MLKAAIVVASIAFASSAMAGEGDVGGTYDVFGKNPDGSQYTGTAVIDVAPDGSVPGYDTRTTCVEPEPRFWSTHVSVHVSDGAAGDVRAFENWAHGCLLGIGSPDSAARREGGRFPQR